MVIIINAWPWNNDSACLVYIWNDLQFYNVANENSKLFVLFALQIKLKNADIILRICKNEPCSCGTSHMFHCIGHSERPRKLIQ